MESLTGRRVPCTTAPERQLTHDQQIASALRDRLQQSPHLAIRQVTCDYREGVAILRGTVPTYYSRQIAITLARSVEGVQVLDDKIQVSHT